MQVHAQMLANRLARTLAIGAALLGMAPAASAVTMAWTPIGFAGNADDSTGYGGVSTLYNIGTYEVTNSQYAEFLNAKAKFNSDPLGLWNPDMASAPGGITRTGVSGNYAYSTTSAQGNRGNLPVNFVSFYDTLRFANWMNNGQGAGDTETGTYTLDGGTPTPSNGATVTRNAGATIFLTSEDEWYKAAYHDAMGLAATNYFDYPGGSNTETVCAPAPGVVNTANCALPIGDPAVGDLTPVGSYLAAFSPHRTFDQAGNVAEFNEAIISSNRGLRGGDYLNLPGNINASLRSGANPSFEDDIIGFRLAMVPEPGTGLLVLMGMLGLAHWRRPNA